MAMGFAIALSMLFFAIYIEAHPHLNSPSPSPTITPKPKPYPYTHHPPRRAPSPSPSITPKPKPHPPSPIYAPSPSPTFSFPRSYVVVKGFVHCKSCKHGHYKNLGSTPLRGATVKLQCNNTRITQQVEVKTAKNGSFYIKAPKNVTSYGAHKCKVFLVSPPSKSKCTKPSQLNGGVKGASLRPFDIFYSNSVPTVLYNVGPFAFLTPKC